MEIFDNHLKEQFVYQKNMQPKLVISNFLWAIIYSLEQLPKLFKFE